MHLPIIIDTRLVGSYLPRIEDDRFFCQKLLEIILNLNFIVLTCVGS
jgi:hypothetical protein